MEYKVIKFLKEVVERGKLKGVTLVAGEEEYLIKTLLDKLKSLYEYTVLWGDEINLEELVKETSAGGMFIGNAEKVCIIHRADAFFKSLNKKDTERLVKLFEGSSGVRLVFVINSKPNKKELSKEPYKSILNKGDFVLSERLSRQKIKDLIKRKFDRNGEGIEDDAVELLLNTTGANLMLLKQESEKLISYAGNRKVNKEDVRRVCLNYGDYTVFDFIDAFFDKDLGKALKVLKFLYSSGVNALQVQALLISYAIKLYLIHESLDRGDSLDTAFTKLSINHPLMKHKFKAYIQKFGKRESRELIDNLYKLDTSVKTYYRNPEDSLEEFTLKNLVAV